jgi:hypothetical protein
MPAPSNDPSVAPPKLLLDGPACTPGLGFDEIATRLAALIEGSEPGFAIGIFGEWGTGKTTLMHAIRRHLSPESTIPVAFNAWRYEREPELLVPLLDAIRQALSDWVDDRENAVGVERVREAASRIGRLARALLSGASAEIGLPGTGKVKYDMRAALDALQARGDDAQAPQSLYFAGFRELSEAAGAAAEGGVDRIVVLIDDLDRCLPTTAVAVLEALKLFFDLPGFIFVVGLDDDVIEAALLPKMWPLFIAEGLEYMRALDSGEEPDPEIAAEQAISQFKRVFQVRYEVPTVRAEGLDELLECMAAEATLDGTQQRDLGERVRPYLSYLARNGRINPRRTKEFVNAYTLATLLQPELDRDIVLALNVIAARSEWSEASTLIHTDPGSFVDALRAYRDGDGAALRRVWPADQAVPYDFAAFAITAQAEPLTRTSRFDVYAPDSRRPASSPSATSVEAELDALHRVLDDIRQLEGPGDQLLRLRSDALSRIGRLADFVPPGTPLSERLEFAAEVERFEQWVVGERPDPIATDEREADDWDDAANRDETPSMVAEKLNQALLSLEDRRHALELKWSIGSPAPSTTRPFPSGTAA